MKYTIPLTNYTVGRNGFKPEAFVIHIQQGTQAGTASWFQSPISQVSSHVAIAKDGSVDNFVDEKDTAYHAGRVNAPIWAGFKAGVNPNAYTIGIECEGFRGDLWTEPQMVAVCNYVKLKAGEFGIALTRRNIVSHNEITADKENMTGWCDEIVRRLNTPLSTPTPDKKAEALALLERATNLIKSL